MSELDKATALMFPAFSEPKGSKPAGGSAGPRRAAEAPSAGTPAPAASAPAPSRKHEIVKAGEDAALIDELLAFVDSVGLGREIHERLPNPLHYGVVTKTGGTLRGQLRIYSIAGGRVGRVTFKDRTDERDHGDAVRERMALWNKKQGG